MKVMIIVAQYEDNETDIYIENMNSEQALLAMEVHGLFLRGWVYEEPRKLEAVTWLKRFLNDCKPVHNLRDLRTHRLETWGLELIVSVGA